MLFCNETDNHIGTVGPRGIEIIQYFACKKFVEMTPKERFQELRRRGFVFNVYSLEHHRAQANTVMVNARQISLTKTYHMTNIQPKSMLLYVMRTEELQKMNSFF